MVNQSQMEVMEVQSKEGEQEKTERFQMMASPDWIRSVDDWRFAHRIGSRAKAIRILVETALRYPQTKTATE